ncbi:helix-turn-helix domain-containing protein [Actinospica sp.]|jgi:AcrR family transcriptional regulator|uniref:TetR/AcrR family transcriptional regulator n=1 Tax=Actinospica sp. TaxID=1872142 RepID=UPI002C5A7486|nr:helix-turn-helix domain-containing protein [Actinospica sp.]HWG22519.1 helix-turn-helix domain-containing protein [Actinospica sp.]
MNAKSEMAAPDAATATRPLRRDAERNRQLILGAAKVVFAQRGLEASLDEIAKEAGLGVGTVYRRFPNRDALIDALLDDTVASIERIVDEAAELPRAWDGLVYFITEMLEKQGNDKGLRDVMLTRESHLNEWGPEKDDIIRAKVTPVVDHLVRRAQQEGDLREDVATTDLGIIMIASVSMVEFTAAVAPDIWRRQLSITLDGLRARPAGATIPLTQPPIDDAQLDVCMTGWKYGSRQTPRQRPKPC